MKPRAQGNKELKAQNYPSLRAALLRFINFLPQKFIQPLVLFQRDSCHIRFEQSQTHIDSTGLILSKTGLLRRIKLGKQMNKKRVQGLKGTGKRIQGFEGENRIEGKILI